MTKPKSAPQRIDHYMTDVVFRPGNAVGLVYLRNPRDALSCSIGLFPALTRALIQKWIIFS